MENAAEGAVSPDGSRIAYLPGPQFTSELWLMDADGANPQEMAVPDKPPDAAWSGIFPVVWSPTGQRLAYIECYRFVAPEPGDLQCSLRTRNAGGGDLTILTDDPRVRQALCWAADGRIFYASSGDFGDERNDQAIYSIRVTNALERRWVLHNK